MGRRTEIGVKSQRLATAGFVVSFIALGATIVNSLRDVARDRDLEEVQVRQVLSEVLDLMGGEAGSTWVTGKLEPGDRRRLEQARRKLDNQVLLIRPGHKRGLELKAVYFARLGQMEAAVDILQGVMDRHPDYAKGWANLGAALFEYGDVDGAHDALVRAVGLDPDYSQAHDTLGRVLEAKGELEQAELEYRAATDADPWYAPAYHNLGALLDELGRAAEAEEAYREAIRNAPDLMEPHYNLALNLYSRGRVREAEREMERAIELGFVPPEEERP